MAGSSSSPLPRNLRRLRAARDLTVVQLAKEAGVGRATLTQIEAGTGNPTLETLYALANVLHVPLTDLIAEDPAISGPRVIRNRSGEPVSGQAVDAWLLFRQRSSSLVVELYAVVIREGVVQKSEPHRRDTREHLHVHAGSVRVGPLDEPLDLNAGDYADFPADRDHQYHVTGSGPVTATLCIIAPA